MAIEIINTIEKRGIPFWVALVFIISIVGSLGLLISYIYFSSAIGDMKSQSEKIALSINKTPEERALENRLISAEGKISSFSGLLANHKNVVKVFDLLEKSTHPKTWFSSFSFSKDKNTVNLTGEADSFIVLGQQMSILEKEPFFKNITLSGVSMSEEKQASFSLEIVLDPQIYKQ
jgi:hypothetical protein